MHTDAAAAHRLELGFDTSQKGYILIRPAKHIAHSHHHVCMAYNIKIHIMPSELMVLHMLLIQRSSQTQYTAVALTEQ